MTTPYTQEVEEALKCAEGECSHPDDAYCQGDSGPILAALVRSQAEEIAGLKKAADRGKQAGTPGDLSKCGHNKHWITWFGDNCMACCREKAEAKVAELLKSLSFIEDKRLRAQEMAAGQQLRSEQAESSLAAMTKERDEWRTKANTRKP